MRDPDSERWEKVERLIDEVLERAPAERDAWLRRACAGDDALLAEVRDLIEAGERADDFLASAAAERAADLIAQTPELQPGPMPTPMSRTRIGPFRLVRELGRGGMGTVFLAEREEHFRQRVALKLIRPGLHLDDRVIARFRKERQLLAELEHPGIARLLDGGVTEDGLPWFAMEYVEGEPIDRACDARRLSMEARLELFCAVCDPVEFAHARRIVHRDIKPSNILVADTGGVKLLDFGIATLLATEDARTDLTAAGLRFFTPDYASPEQVRGDPVTAASDVYSLGVLLHELLTSDQMPDRLPGRLDDIVRTAIAREPSQRYGSAGALAADVRRYLDGLPVTARRAARGTWRAVIAGAAVVAAVALGMIVRTRAPSAGSTRAGPVVAVGRIADRRGGGLPDAVHSLADLLATNLARVPGLRVISTARLYELLGRSGAQEEIDPGAYTAAARRAGASVVIDGDVYTQADGRLRLDLRRIDLATGRILSALTVTSTDLFTLVDSGTARLAAVAGAVPPSASIADVTTRSEVGYRFYAEGLRSYYRGDVTGARALFDAAIAEDSAFAMAQYYRSLTEERLDVSVPMLRRALRLADRASDRERLIIRAAWQTQTSDPAALATAETLAVRYPQEPEGQRMYARVLHAAADYAGAVRRFREVVRLDSLAEAPGELRCTACDARAELVETYVAMDSLSAAEREARRWTEIEPRSAKAWDRLATVLALSNQLVEARAAFVHAAEIDPSLRATPNYYAVYYLLPGDLAAADAALRQIIRSGTPQWRADATWYLAVSLRRQGRLDEAYRMAREFRRAVESRLGTSYGIHAAMEAQVLFEQGRYRSAAALFDSMARVRFDAFASPSRDAQYRTWNLTHEATALAALGDTSALARLADSVRAAGELSLLARDRRLHHHVRGLLLVARGDDAAAIDEFRQAMFSPGLGYARTNYEWARALLRLGRPREAIAILQPTIPHLLEGGGLYVTRTDVQELLAQAWDRAGVRDSALVHYRAVLDVLRQSDPPFAARVSATRDRVMELERGTR